MGDLTKSTFPMDVSKLSPTPLITTTDSLLMSNTKVPQSTQKLSHTTQLPTQPHTMPQLQLTTLPQSSKFMLKKLPLIISVSNCEDNGANCDHCANVKIA